MEQKVEESKPAVNEGLLRQIDGIRLSPRLRAEREQFFAHELEITSDRAVLAMESWKETQGDVLDVRWARLVEKWAARLPIVIFKDQLVVGNQTKLFRGADPWVEYDAPNVVEVMEKDKRQIRTSAARVSGCEDEVWEAIEETVRFFLGNTPVDAMFRSLAALYGDWPEELEKARGTIRQGKYNLTPPTPDWRKLLVEGLHGVRQAAETGIERIRMGVEPEARKAWFWQAVTIVCDAAVRYAHRYARLARDLAENENNLARRVELEEIAGILERVPEYPARTLQEAIQARVIWGVAMQWCRPDHAVDESGRVDQEFYSYFIDGLRERRLTLEQAGDLIGTLLSNLARRDGVKSVQRGQHVQGTLHSNVTLGGVTADGRDANNELTYLILHMAGLLRYAEPHYTFRLRAETPGWALIKALDTNRKVGGGQPQFMSDDRVIAYLVEQGEALEDARDWAGHG
ncbi:MAG: hypothetical protein HYY32_02300 [Chloroflexi bacterium]|nr:hypothetical protein [Chloroflexota bacterium]